MAGSKPVVGVLALQGDIDQHRDILEQLGCEVVLVKKPEQLNDIKGLVLPGGESGAMLRMLRPDGFLEILQASNLPILGTCAGAILLAKTVENPPQESLEKIPITIIRNGYGRQTDSFDDTVTTTDDVVQHVSARFIRAPIISDYDEDVEILAVYDDKPVAVRYDHYLATTFHPELTGELYFHRLFLKLLQ
ncbi:pyridoxal 5'-phosphate synthase glutaminase subunit PdxT [Candidatus Saccharibacteria bacterium]|nr:pyridoxal 5'-phosphate synthase glutaminase subunit PdxT [Candidatus Saccharibacteria bacterium]